MVNSAIGSSIVIIVSISTASTHPCTLYLLIRVTITVSSSLGITYVGGVIVFEVVNTLPTM